MFLFLCFVPILFKIYLSMKKVRRKYKVLTFGFFHPYCNAGGGGERVLWAAIRSVQKKYKDAQCVVYTGDLVPEGEILKNVELRFNITFARKVDFVYLKSRFFVESKYYPFFTLLMQNLGSICLGIEAIIKLVPDVYFDTMGYAWTYPLFKYFGSCKIAAYVHYPTISTDMLKVVKDRQVTFNNRRFISQNKYISYLKLQYYKIFSYLYRFVGTRADVVMVNSSWTQDHIIHLWKKVSRTVIVYPPCDVTEFSNIPLDSHNNKSQILSIAQFRPEKNHELQIRAFHSFLNKTTEVSSPTLALIGSCRHEEDYQRVNKLKDLCTELGIANRVEFKINLTFKEIIEEMKNSNVALHTMTNEHFGIGVVECLAAGLVTIAHDSGGPKLDILVPYEGERTGFLADDIASFADAMEQISKMDNVELCKIRERARKSMLRFSEQMFENAFLTALEFLNL